MRSARQEGYENRYEDVYHKWTPEAEVFLSQREERYKDTVSVILTKLRNGDKTIILKTLYWSNGIPALKPDADLAYYAWAQSQREYDFLVEKVGDAKQVEDAMRLDQLADSRRIQADGVNPELLAFYRQHMSAIKRLSKVYEQREWGKYFTPIM